MSLPDCFVKVWDYCFYLFLYVRPVLAKLVLKMGQPRTQSVLGAPQSPLIHFDQEERGPIYPTSSGKKPFINISCRKAMSDWKPLSQPEINEMCLFPTKTNIFFENSHFPANSCVTGKFLSSSSIWKDKVSRTRCCHLVFLGGLIWTSNNGSSQSN